MVKDVYELKGNSFQTLSSSSIKIFNSSIQRRYTN